MKGIQLLLFSISFYSLSLSAQSDTLFLTNGKIIHCTIGKMGIDNVRYSIDGTQKFQKISNNEVRDYYIGDDFFNMNPEKRMGYETVFEVNGYSKDEIFRGVLKWIMGNQKEVLSDGIAMANEENTIVVGNLYTGKFAIPDFATVALGIADDIAFLEGKKTSGEHTYQLNYQVKIRAKDNRLKLFIADMQLVSNLDKLYDRPFIELFYRRFTQSGQSTQNLENIRQIKELLQSQIKSIQKYVEQVRNDDVLKAEIVKTMLSDDAW